MAAALEASALGAKLAGGHAEVASALKSWVGPAIEERRALVRAKLANEPSVASLMGAPPIVAPDPPRAGAGKATTAAAPTDTTRDAPIPPTETMRDADMTALPHTAPMAARTLASPGAVSTPGVVPTPIPGVGSTLRSEAGQVEAPRVNAPPPLAFQDPTRGDISLEVPSPPQGVPRKSAWVFPVLAAAAFFVIAGTGFVLYGARARSAPDAPTTAAPPTPSASASSTTSPATATPSSSAATSASSAVEPTPAVGAKPTAKPTSGIRPVKPPVAPVPAPPPAGRKPPPNPYDDKP
jgi:hypothetical protein